MDSRNRVEQAREEAQLLARHSDPGLTLHVYAKVGIHDLGRALDRFSATAPEISMAARIIG